MLLQKVTTPVLNSESFPPGLNSADALVTLLLLTLIHICFANAQHLQPCGYYSWSQEGLETHVREKLYDQHQQRLGSR